MSVRMQLCCRRMQTMLPLSRQCHSLQFYAFIGGDEFIRKDGDHHNVKHAVKVGFARITQKQFAMAKLIFSVAATGIRNCVVRTSLTIRRMATLRGIIVW